jgi:hypothetical protein
MVARRLDVYAWGTLILHLKADLTSLHLPVYIDNKALLFWIKKWKFRGLPGTLYPKHNLIQAAMDISDKQKIAFHLYDIMMRAHQDVETEYDQLPWAAKLNVDCDALTVYTRACRPNCNKKLQEN